MNKPLAVLMAFAAAGIVIVTGCGKIHKAEGQSGSSADTTDLGRYLKASTETDHADEGDDTPDAQPDGPGSTDEKTPATTGNKIIAAQRANANPIDRETARQALLRSYPSFVRDIRDNTIYFTDGSSMPFDDGKTKNWNTLLDDSDPEDMFYTPYNSAVSPPPYLSDPGRMRCDALFKKMYGGSAEAVRAKMKNVEWFGRSVQFNTANGAADALRAVAQELASHPELRKYLDSSGTFNWRPVRGAKRMSAHSYGVAFDIAVPYADYWQWKLKTNDELAKVPYHNRIPRKIVEIFERHGFIWGGAWYHYDTMHFEYRPDLLYYARHRK